jgi:hypothetical protein
MEDTKVMVSGQPSVQGHGEGLKVPASEVGLGSKCGTSLLADLATKPKATK